MHNYFERNRIAISEATSVVDVVAISNPTTLEEGETAVLACVGYGDPSADARWFRDGMLITNSSLVSTYRETVDLYGVTLRQSFLELCSVDPSDSGVFTCVVDNFQVRATADVQLDVTLAGCKLKLTRS